MKKIIVAIDGHSSCGKSTLAKALAGELGYTYIDTGAMYRAVTLYFIRHQVPLDDPAAIQEALDRIHIRFQRQQNRTDTMLNGENVEKEIRKMYVTELVSPVSAISAVRRALVSQQQAMGRERGIVMDGRDIGTVVFPEAELKIFLTANPEIRAMRRYLELQEKGLEVDLDRVRQNLHERDHIDSTRADSPLRKAEDAQVIDNSHMDREEQVKLALEMVAAAV